jgi:hypothetical protein
MGHSSYDSGRGEGGLEQNKTTANYNILNLNAYNGLWFLTRIFIIIIWTCLYSLFRY